MGEGQFILPVWYDLLATFAFAITGAVLGLKKRYDIVGVVSLAIAVGVGGGVIRDGVFLQTIPAAATDWRYLGVILLAVLVAIVMRQRLQRDKTALMVEILDALGLAAFTVVGTQKSLFFGLAIVGAVLVGAINAVGGGVLRDILGGGKPRIFLPSQLYALISVSGALLFIVLYQPLLVDQQLAALIAMAAMIISRIVVIMYDVKTVPAHELVRLSSWRTSGKR